MILDSQATTLYEIQSNWQEKQLKYKSMLVNNLYLPLQGTPNFNLPEGAVEENHSDLTVSALLKL